MYTLYVNVYMYVLSYMYMYYLYLTYNCIVLFGMVLKHI